MAGISHSVTLIAKPAQLIPPSSYRIAGGVENTGAPYQSTGLGTEIVSCWRIKINRYPVRADRFLLAAYLAKTLSSQIFILPSLPTDKDPMTRTDAIARAHAQFQSGDFLAELGRRVAYRTESQSGGREGELRAYLDDELTPALAALDFTTRVVESPSGKSPFLLAEHRESTAAPTVLMYGHGDVVDGMEGQWRGGLDPWRTTQIDNRIYGRGTADNKGQHSINLAALRAVREARGGKLGFNAKFIIEMGEEIGSPDLGAVCRSLRDELKADLFVASDGPRLSADRPTIFLGCRGGIRIHLDVDLREGAHHSGNWGGVLANPAIILANAIATLVDGHGRLKLDALKPPRLSNQMRAALADVKIETSVDEPQLSAGWGEEGLSAAERLYAWNTLEVLAISSGNIDKPANAIPGL